MKHITVGISTRNRWAKLTAALASIPEVKWISIFVFCDRDNFTAKRLTSPGGFYDFSRERPRLVRRPDLVIYSPDHVGNVGGQNSMSPLARDGYITLMDDMEFEEGSLETALESFNRHFPDDLGVLGFNQYNLPKFNPAGCALVGRRFLDRLPWRLVYNPDYWHFADGELYRWALELGRFHLEEKAMVKHNHPAVTTGQADQTHADARKRKAADQALSHDRAVAGKVWGKPEEEDEGLQEKMVHGPPQNRAIDGPLVER
jgi:hypothetical protein